MVKFAYPDLSALFGQDKDMEYYVRRIREGQGLSLRELSKRSGIAISYIMRVEAGEANPSVKIMCRLARALGVPVQELFSCKDKRW